MSARTVFAADCPAGQTYSPNFQKCIQGTYNFGTSNQQSDNSDQGGIGAAHTPFDSSGIDGRLNGTGGIGSNGSNGGSQSLQNPLQYNSVDDFFRGLLHIIVIFAIPIIVLMIIYAGFLYVMAQGNEEQVTKATRALTYAVLGGLIILGAELILQIIKGTVSQLTI